jgi:hypothetical protein
VFGFVDLNISYLYELIFFKKNMSYQTDRIHLSKKTDRIHIVSEKYKEKNKRHWFGAPKEFSLKTGH